MRRDFRPGTYRKEKGKGTSVLPLCICPRHVCAIELESRRNRSCLKEGTGLPRDGRIYRRKHRLNCQDAPGTPAPLEMG